MKELHDILDGVVFEGEYYGVNNGETRLYFTAPKDWLDEEYASNGAVAARIMVKTILGNTGEKHIKVMMSPVFTTFMGDEYEGDWYDWYSIPNRRNK